jgi:PAS domain S-box-containing protein
MFPGKYVMESRIKRHIRISCGLIFFLSIAAGLNSQHFFTRHYTRSDGMASANVYAIQQDSNGKMWFGTRAGISVYDGVTWESFYIADGLPAMTFKGLQLDRKGRMWALSAVNQGTFYIVYYDGNRWNEIPPPLQIPEIKLETTTAFTLMQRLDHTILAVGSRNNGIIFWRRGEWRHISKKDGLPDNSVNGIVTLDDRFFVATNKGLAVIDPQLNVYTGLNEKLNLPEDKLNIKGIGIEYRRKYSGSNLQYDRIWLYGHHWLGYFDKSNQKIKYFPVELFLAYEKDPVKLLPDYRCGLYIANKYRVNYFNYKAQAWESIGMSNGLISDGANSMFIDFEKNVWISCDRGVTKIASRRFTNLHMVHGLLEDEVTAVFEYEPGKFVLGHNTGVTLYDGKTYRPIMFHRGNNGGVALIRTLDVQVDSKKNLWLALAFGGIARIDPNHHVTYYGKDDGIPEQVVCLWVDKNDNVWFGAGEGLYMISRQGVTKKYIDNYSPLYTRKIYGDRNGLRYIATMDSGIYIYEPEQKKWNNYRVTGPSSGNNVYCIKKSSRGQLLVGSLDGLYQLQDKQLKRVRINEFTIERPVYFIVEDKNYRLWCGTDNGVVCWDGKKVTRYNTSDGLVGHETNRAAGILDSRGRIWIGTNRGVSIYNREYDNTDYFAPKPRLHLMYMDIPATKRRFSLKPSPPGQPEKIIKLKHTENTLVFNFRGISFRDETALRFRIKLEGQDDDWLPEELPYRQLVRRSNLNPGLYRFHIKVRNAQGIWSDVLTSPWITIARPYYRTWWFYLLLLLTASGIFYSILQYLSQRKRSVSLGKEVKERTDQLADVERRYRSLFEESKDVVFFATPEGRFVDINPAGVDLFGYESREELKTITNAKDIYEELERRNEFLKVLEQDGFVKDYEVEFKKKGGEKIIAQITATLVRNKKGESTGYRGIIRDITHQKHLEEQLIQAQKMEAIGTLAGGIAHDFNNILGVILGYTELALDDLPRDTLAARNLQHVLTAGLRASELVKQILAFSRQSERKRKPLKVSPILRETLKLLRSTLPVTIDIRRNIKVNSDTVLADPAQIQQIIMNLCTNAAHAMREKGGILEVGLTDLYIDHDSELPEQLKPDFYLRLSVSDTGHGIPKVVIKRIFEPYFTTKKTGEGTGMGLAVIHGIVKGYGGDISVYSEPGKGTTFHVFLPLIQEKAENVVQGTGIAPGGTERILLVDDEEYLIKVGTQMLERLGYEVVAESNALKALEQVKKDPLGFDLIISDITMPNMTGIQLTKELKSLSPDLPVILCSGFSTAVTGDELKKLGVKEFVMKPIIKNDLARVIRKALDE